MKIRLFITMPTMNPKKRKVKLKKLKKNVDPDIPTTFVELHAHLQSTKKKSIIPWLKERWGGKDKQESLLRLFAVLGLIEQLQSYSICKDNFNSGTSTPLEDMRGGYYDEKNDEIKLKDSGDKSDLHGLKEIKGRKIILATTSKNNNNTNLQNLDLDSIENIHSKEWSTYELHICIVVRDAKDLLEKKDRLHETSKRLKEIIERPTTIILDWSDLDLAYKRFKKLYGKVVLKEILDNFKKPILFKFHQQLALNMVKMLIIRGYKEIALGHLPRSGKTYILAGIIINGIENNEKNHFIITNAVNETRCDLMNILDCFELRNVNIRFLNAKSKKKVEESLTGSNVIVCSDKYLKNSKTGIKEFEWLKKLKFSTISNDESHMGSTSDLSKKVFGYYSHVDTVKIFMTATYDKVVSDYELNDEQIIKWDLDDIAMMKQITKPESQNYMFDKHGVEMRKLLKENKQTLQNLEDEYKNNSQLVILTPKIKSNIKNAIKKRTINTDMGYSTEGILTLVQEANKNGLIVKKSIYQDERKVIDDIIYKIFPKCEVDEFGIEYPSQNECLFNTYKSICQKKGSRIIGEYSEPLVMLMFLPPDGIDNQCKAFEKVLKKVKIDEKFEIVSINSKISSDPKKRINNAINRAKNTGKDVIVCSGLQCHLAVTIPQCDIVVMLNNTKSYDRYKQMIYRCMTAAENKKFGFVFDMNENIAIQNTFTFARKIFPSAHPKEGIKLLLTQNLLKLNPHHFEISEGFDDKEIDNFCDTLYERFTDDYENAIEQLQRGLRRINIKLEEEDQEFTNNLQYTAVEKSKLKKEKKEKEDEKLNKGLKKKTVEKNKKDEEDEDKIHNVNYVNIFAKIMPFICLVSNDSLFEFNEMFESVMLDKKDLLKTYLEDSFGFKLTENDLKKIKDIYLKYMSNNQEVKTIVRTLKEIFKKNRHDLTALSILIDQHLIVSNLEKEKSGEVSTPYFLRQDMIALLKKYRPNFFKQPRKVFEPCCGKGGFVVDLTAEFQDGLKELYPDPVERTRVIMEECIYYADINAVNIEIVTNVLLDPENKYAKNYYLGDTLEIETLPEFDLVIGNPPYNADGINNGATLWQKFVRKSIECWIKPEGLLCYVHPNGWRKPTTERCSLNHGLFEQMTQENTMLELHIHNAKDGQKTFNCGTRYDYYLMKKKHPNEWATTIIDEERVETHMKITGDWLGNFNLEKIKNVTSDETKCKIVKGKYSRTSKKHSRKNRSEEFKYPLIYQTPTRAIRLIWSNIYDKHDKTLPKVIIGDSGGGSCQLDMESKFGMTGDAFGIVVDNEEEGNAVLECVNSKEFADFMKSLQWSGFRWDMKVFKDFNKDFYRHFNN